MQLKYKWENVDIDNIDWTIHGNALHSIPARQRKTTTQLIHNWLPVNGHPGRTQHTSNTLCPGCSLHIETQQHFLTCTKYNEQWDKHLQKAGILEVDQNMNHLNHILYWAVTHHEHPDQHFPLQTIPQQYHKLIEDQSSIGWNQILLGRWALEWVRQYDITNPDQGVSIATAKLTSLWTAVYNVWQYRCDLQHKDIENSEAKQRHQIQPQVQAIYNLKHRLDHIDQQCLEQTQKTTLKLPIKQLKDWLVRTENFVKKGLQRAKKRLKQKNHAITSYFQPKPQTTAVQHYTAPSTHPANNLQELQPLDQTTRENFRPP